MAVAEIFLTAFITVLFEKLASHPDFWKSIRGEGIASQLKKSIKLLSLLRAVLVDAGRKQITDEAVRDWVNDLQALTYDLDDIVDELLYEATRRELRAESRSTTSSSSSSCSCSSMSMVTSLIPTNCFIPLVFNRHMKTKLDEITERLKDLIEQKNVLGLRDNVPSSSNRIAERLPTTSLVIEPSIQGRDDDKKAVLHLLLDDKTCGDGSVGIIPIVGMGGVGKTTLAQLVYNEEKVKAWFDVRAWACVSDDFDVFEITKVIFQDVTGERSEFETLNQIQMALKERISKMKFLIVLDDIWNQNREKWELLQCSFQVGLPGSKVIVTTRNDGVVSTMRCGPSYRLKELTEVASISLFAQKSLGTESFEAHPNLRVIGECIVRKCRGLPLALKTLGSLLRTKASVEEWDELLKSDIWNLSVDESSILPALRLSYHHLSPDLKQLFAYCSLFPKDYSFDIDELVLLWMGEGFLQNSDRHQRMEDLGLKYFKELLSRSFFQHSSDGVSRYVMHDMMNDLAQFVAGEFFFRSDDEKKKGRENIIKKRSHHASFIRQEYEVFSNFKEFHTAKGLRTFLPLPVQKLEGWPSIFYISNNIVVDLVPKLQCLRVLSLSGYAIRELADSIRRMKHLRYLNLSQTLIECLPEWVSHLYNLQTLLLFGCKNLARLPTTFMYLTGMRHFNIADTPTLKEMPLGIGTLTSLQTLSKMLLTEGSGSRLRELKDLPDLRGILSITGLHNVMNVHDAKAANLISKQGLDDLEMMWSENFDGSRDEALEKEVLDALKPSSNLRRVEIRYYGGVEFPSWVGNPSFCVLGEVTLRGCRKCTSLPSLGQLPHLKKLFLWSAEGVKVVGSEFYITTGDGRIPVAFPSLEMLQFVDMGNWEEWSSENVDDNVALFPRLEKLVIYGSPNLVKVSLRKVPSLQVLEMGGCGEVSLRSMLGVASEITTLKIDNIEGLTGLHEEGVLDRFVGVKIVDLEIGGCKELKYLWRRGSEACANLKRLSVDYCDRLVSLVEVEVEGEGVLPPHDNLEELWVTGCENLEKLPDNWGNNLKSLTISNCTKLKYSSGTATMKQQQGLDEEEEETGFCRLERMVVSSCSSLTWLPTGGGGGQNKKKKKKLPTTLKYLEIYGCHQLEEPEEKNWLLNSKSSLETICIDNWWNLKSFTRGGGGGFGFQNFIHLTSLWIWRCHGLESFPERGGGGLPPCLTELDIIDCKNLKCLLPNTSNYGGWDQCDSLTHLRVSDCPSLEGFPCGVWPPHLKELRLSGELGGGGGGELGLHNAPPTLVYLSLSGSKFRELVSFSINSLPSSIITLELVDMEKLETLSSMDLQNLTSLQHLRISNCPKLRSLPEALLPSLHSLQIFENCQILKEKCSSKKKRGDYWPLLLSHIPRGEIDGQQLRI